MTRPQNKPRPRPVYDCACGDHCFTALTQGYITLVSPEDRRFLEERAWNARVQECRQVYVTAKRNDESLRLHREIMGAQRTEDYVDHVNGNGLDNRRRCTLTGAAQLRASCAVGNGQNKRPRTSFRNTRIPGVKGVYFVAGLAKPYRARIMARGDLYHIGYFDSLIEAAEAYNIKAREVHGDNACLNDLSAIEERARAAAE